MSAIFKTRKTPRHLIIEEEAQFNRRSRQGPMRVLIWVVGLILLAGLLLLAVQLGLQVLEETGF